MGRTPLHYAAASLNSDLYDILVAGGASEEVVDYVRKSNHKNCTKHNENSLIGV